MAKEGHKAANVLFDENGKTTTCSRVHGIIISRADFKDFFPHRYKILCIKVHHSFLYGAALQ